MAFSRTHLNGTLALCLDGALASSAAGSTMVKPLGRIPSAQQTGLASCTGDLACHGEGLFDLHRHQPVLTGTLDSGACESEVDPAGLAVDVADEAAANSSSRFTLFTTPKAKLNGRGDWLFLQQ